MFKTEADVMLDTAGRVDNTNDQVQSELARLRNTVDGVQAAWAGKASTSFADLMVRWDSSANRLQEALTSIADNIRSNAHNFEDREASNAASFNNVGGGDGGLVL